MDSFEVDEQIDMEFIVGEEHTVEMARMKATRLGIDPTNERISQQIAAKRSAARLEAQQTIAPPTRFDNFSEVMDKGLTATGQLITMALYLVIARIGLPVSIIPLWVAEMQRVNSGIALFDAERSSLLSITAVSAYMVLRIVRASKAHGSVDGEDYVFSLRQWWRGFCYTMGWQRAWKPKNRTELQRLDRSIMVLGWLIILLGTVGSMQNEMTVSLGDINRAYFEARSLAWLLSMIGGLVLTAGLLSATHWLTGYLHGVYVQIRGDETEAFFTYRSSERVIIAAEDQAEMIYLQSLIGRRMLATGEALPESREIKS